MGLISRFISELFGTKQLMKTANTNNSYSPNIPNFQGDYAKTIFLWAFNKSSPVKKQSEYARYFLYECGIRDAVLYHRQLIKEGYFTKASMEEKLKTLKVADLKLMLKELEQPVTGKKDILIKRVLENADEQYINNHCESDVYELSEKGHLFLEDHYDYVNIHKHKNWGIDWRTYDIKHKQGYSFYDTVFEIFNERISKGAVCFGRNEYYNMYQALAEENKREQALEMLMRVLYIDLSGVDGIDDIALYKKGECTYNELRDSFDIFIMLAPGIVEPIAKYADVYNDDMVKHIYEWHLPVQICSKSLFLEIVHSVIDGTYNEQVMTCRLKAEYIKYIKALR